MDRLGEQLRSCVLEEEAAGARLERAVDVLVEVERRDDHHGERILDGRPGQRARGLEPVELGHPDVEQADIGPQLPGQRHGFPAVARLTHHLDVGLGVQDHAQPGPDELLVVGDEYADGHRVGRARGSTAVDHPAMVGPRPRLEGPAEECRPLRHPDDAVAGMTLDGWTCSPSSRTVSRTDVLISHDLHVDPGGVASVPQRVRH